MKVRDSGSPVPAGSTEESQGTESAKGTAFADKLEQTRATTSATPAGAAAGAKGIAGPLTADIAVRLANKEITPEAAVDQVVSRILDKQMGAGGPAVARSQVESALRDAIEADPVLQAKVKSLAD